MIPPAWMTMWVWPAMVTLAERERKLGLLWRVTVTVPLPVPLAGESAIQELFASGTAVVQAHSAWVAVTETG